MEFKNITYDVEENIATVTINRPKTLNALNSETIDELSHVFDLITADDTVLGVIVTGAGGKAFVAGADIGELATKDSLTGRDFSLSGQATFNKIENLPKPVIAAVNGFALGGGCELSMACHLRVAAAHAKFGQPEVGLGIIPGYGGTQRLPRLVGKGRALELLLGGGIIDAAEAFRIGLANAVVEVYQKDDEGNEIVNEKGRKLFDNEAFLAKVKKMLKGILTKGPIALSYVIDAVNRGLDTDLGSGLKIEADLFGVLYSTEDVKEGLGAFLEKRPANFTGK
ncbi:MAG: enoyl-CoA hydratase-related protein [Candidatus Hatepunaea meridiana]|nr:enoyl-CoA hydratase-related protein [Candidatus Hatepunaea meridiana]